MIPPVTRYVMFVEFLEDCLSCLFVCLIISQVKGSCQQPAVSVVVLPVFIEMMVSPWMDIFTLLVLVGSYRFHIGLARVLVKF